MNELISLLEALLKGRVVTFQVNIAAMVQDPEKIKEMDRFIGCCPKCKKQFLHFTEESLIRALRSHRWQCGKDDDLKTFIQDHMMPK